MIDDVDGPGFVDEAQGDLLQPPGRDLPAGATVLVRTRDDGLQFLGLIAGKAIVEGGGDPREYYVFAGVDRVREMLAVPEVYPTDMVPKYRTDDISILKPHLDVVEPAPAAGDAPTGTGGLPTGTGGLPPK